MSRSGRNWKIASTISDEIVQSIFNFLDPTLRKGLKVLRVMVRYHRPVKVMFLRCVQGSLEDGGKLWGLSYDAHTCHRPAVYTSTVSSDTNWANMIPEWGFRLYIFIDRVPYHAICGERFSNSAKLDLATGGEKPTMSPSKGHAQWSFRTFISAVYLSVRDSGGQEKKQSEFDWLRGNEPRLRGEYASVVTFGYHSGLFTGLIVASGVYVQYSDQSEWSWISWISYHLIRANPHTVPNLNFTMVRQEGAKTILYPIVF